MKHNPIKVSSLKGGTLEQAAAHHKDYLRSGDLLFGILFCFHVCVSPRIRTVYIKLSCTGKSRIFFFHF